MDNLVVLDNQMIPIYQNENQERFVDARELHKFLEVKDKFATWIGRRIAKYGFVEGTDYFTMSQKCEVANGGFKFITCYLLTIDMAKEIAMVENNSRGKQVRRYFIELEKRYKKKQIIQYQEPVCLEQIMIHMLEQQIATKAELAKQAKEQEELKNQQLLLEQKQKENTQAITLISHRINNLDTINIAGDLKQRLTAMIRKYAFNNKMPFGQAWRAFTVSFNMAFKTNLEKLKTEFKKKHNISEKLTTPDYLEAVGKLEDGVRVADKMLNVDTLLNIGC